MHLPSVIDFQHTLAQSFELNWSAVLMILFVIVSVLMILIVLIQRPQGGGLSGAFGASADGAGQTAFGAKTGDALTLATVTIFVLFLLFAIGLNFSLRPAQLPDETTISSTEEDEPASTTPSNLGEGAGSGSGAPIEMERLTTEELEQGLEDGTLQPLGEALQNPGGSDDDAPAETPDDETADPATDPESSGG